MESQTKEITNSDIMNTLQDILAKTTTFEEKFESIEKRLLEHDQVLDHSDARLSILEHEDTLNREESIGNWSRDQYDDIDKQNSEDGNNSKHSLTEDKLKDQ